MSDGRQAIIDTFTHGIASTRAREKPYRHWCLEACVPSAVVDDIIALPFAAPALDGVSGKRELHNATRTYFDTANQEKFPVVRDLADAFQAPEVTKRVEEQFGIDLNGSYLRVEFAQDIDGFWLEPHTDLGVKMFTLLLYISRDPSHENLGTDIYDGDKQHFGRSPFVPGGALIFIPSDNTYHGFEPRKIEGVRKSVIINYVTDEWRAREQLAFPSAPIA